MGDIIGQGSGQVTGAAETMKSLAELNLENVLTSISSGGGLEWLVSEASSAAPLSGESLANRIFEHAGGANGDGEKYLKANSVAPALDSEGVDWKQRLVEGISQAESASPEIAARHREVLNKIKEVLK